jgi:hypothetical protein
MIPPNLKETHFKGDHDFAAWLRSKGWTGEYQHEGTNPDGLGVTTYLSKGHVLCKTLVDNRTCTYRVFA